MTRKVPVQDVYCAVVPAALRGRPEPEVIAAMNESLLIETARQYLGTIGKLMRLEDLHADFLITDDPADVERFQPAHDCAHCRAGNDQAMAHLREHPDQPIGLANISYTEVWVD